MDNTVALQLKNITKSFAGKVANDNVSMTLNEGEILAILGENGSGKTTLMNMISGIYYPDSGQIFIRGKEVSITSPHDAFRYKIGMIHQHFKLVDVFSAVENIILGVKDGKKYNVKEAAKRIEKIVAQYGFDIDINKKIYDMSVSEKQTVEIIKVLYRGADILILDEPTAVLTPQEIDKLFTVLKNMRRDGKSIIIITHKLNEVMEISDRVTILRKGQYIGTVDTCSTNEEQLTEMMVGEKIQLNIERPNVENKQLRLKIDKLSLIHDKIKMLDEISFDVFSGEILGIAGIAGSGQKELLETIAGLNKPTADSTIDYYAPDSDQANSLIGKSPNEIRELGVRLSFVPEDRLGMGLVANMNIIDNMMLRSYRKGKSMFVDRKTPHDLANSIIESLKVVTPNEYTAVRKLSGGNIQKILVGREIASAPTVLMAAYPVRGLDINSSYTIYSLLNEQKQNGVAVIFVGEDLDVLLELCDRIVVVAGGKVTGVVDGRTTDKRSVGALMTKTEKYQQEEIKEEKQND